MGGGVYLSFCKEGSGGGLGWERKSKGGAGAVHSAIIPPMQYLKTGTARLGINLNPSQIEQFQVYYQELTDWTKHINLTTITELKEVQLKHFLDSLTVILAFKQPAEMEGLRIIDIGSGAGFPGLPLKIAFPSIKLTLLEATSKKASFLHHIAHILDIEGAEVIAGRAEEIAHKAEYREQFDVVLSRAVSSLPSLVELTLPFCKTGGIVILQKKGDVEDELRRADKAIELLGGSQPEVKSIDLPELPDNRYLMVTNKMNPTPTQYPRRPGIPIKRPIV